MRKLNLKTVATVRESYNSKGEKIIDETGRRKACPYKQKENINIITESDKNIDSCRGTVHRAQIENGTNIKFISILKNARTRVGAGLDYARDHRGITLIALIITIIVLLILAGVALNFVMGENGILKHAEFASNKYTNSAEKEENELAKVDEYISNSRETITITKEELQKIIEEAQRPQCIDTSREIANIGTGGWETQNYSYTATEDCVVTGKVGSEQNGILDILINSKTVGSVRWAQSWGWSPVSYNLKKGDTIEFKYANDGKSILVNVKVYGLK